MAKSLYQQSVLPSSTKSIRLLRLEECIYDSPDDADLPKALHCSFEVHDLDDAPDFVALSYAWGPEVFRENIFTINGQEWPLRENLCDAMLHIWNERSWHRHSLWNETRQEVAWEKDPENPLSVPQREMIGYTKAEEGTAIRPLLWIDYLCINQGDMKERNHQVALMGTIYSKAMTVAVWLGNSDENSDLLVDFLKRIAPRMKDVREFQEYFNIFIKTEPGKTACCAVLDRPYWTRLWVVQEMFLATRIVMFLGQHSVVYDNQIGWQWFLPDKILDLRTSTHPLYGLGRGTETYKNMGFGNFWHWVQLFSDQQCQDPRDKVYGLLGLSDSSPQWPNADYTMSVEDLYAKVITEFARSALNNDVPETTKVLREKLKPILGVNVLHSTILEADKMSLEILSSRTFPPSKWKTRLP